MKNKTLKVIIKFAGRILLILSVFFVGYKVYSLGFDLSVVEDIPIFIAASLCAVIFNLLSTLVLAYAWGRWIAFFSCAKVDCLDAITIYGKSAIGKYLPGNVMHYIERNLFAVEYGLSQKKIVFSTIMEIVVMILSGVAISIVLLPVSYIVMIEDSLGIDLRLVGLLFAVVFSVFLLVVFAVLRRLDGKALQKKYKPSGFLFTFVIALSAGVACLLLNGLGMYVLWVGLDGTGWETEIAGGVLSAYSAAWVCGFVLPGAPGGIGVREAVLTMLLENIIDGPVLVLMVIAHRIISIIGDFSFYAIVSVRKITAKR